MIKIQEIDSDHRMNQTLQISLFNAILLEIK